MPYKKLPKKEEVKAEIVPFDPKAAEAIGLKTRGASEAAKVLVVKSDGDLKGASELLSNIKMLTKFLKQEKDKFLAPGKAFKAMIEGLWSPMEDMNEQSEMKVKMLMSQYHDTKMVEQAKKQASIATREEKGKLKPETAVKKMEELGEVKTNIKTEAGSSTFSKIKKMRIIDESRVPDVYWKIDEVILRSAILMESKKLDKLGELIPGVEVYEETIVGGRG